ncbi:MAG: DNA polymerase IV [Parcubacteria group bacterium Gr01-1014_33]|nr:MAG: DNA polymerase IV [Parcubacteria group bacterium Gr01-1014_33]
MNTRIIAHLDLDAFFASVEEREHEWLAGKPIVVGADPQEGKGRGVVSTANYKARAYGIYSAMPISKAWQLAEVARKQGKPPAVFLGTNLRRYGEVSRNIMAIIRNHVSVVEEASIDEAYFDISVSRNYAAVENICRQIKEEIREKEKLTCSIGIGPNKLIAKIASDMQKPDGLTRVEEKDAEKFLEPLPLRKIPGIGPKTELLFAKRGIAYVRDLKRSPQEELESLLGKWGKALYHKIRGQDDSPVEENYEIKSIGAEETFSQDTLDPALLLESIEKMCRDILKRFRKDKCTSFRTVAIKVRFSDFKTISRAHTLDYPARKLDVLRFEALKLFMPFLDKRENPHKKLIRLVGVRMEKLE